MSSPGKKAPPQKPTIPVSHFVEPQPFAQITKVRLQPGTGASTGTLCACGTAPVVTGANLDGVWAKIIGVNDPQPHSGIAHPADATPGTVSGGNWLFVGGAATEVPGAPCVAMPQANNSQLAVWWHYTDGTTLADSTLFAGMCSNQTNCDGSGSPCAQAVGVSRVFAAGAAQVVDTAPAQYNVTGKGFTAKASAVFNGNWVLRLRQEVGATYTWDNGGDGTTVPRVELRCDGPQATSWELLFRLGRCTVQYTKPAAEWQALRANTFTTLGGTRGHRGQLPVSLTVKPV